MGCLLDVTMEGNRVTAVSGNSCSRGPEYARRELINPTRTLTTTVAVSGGELPLVPVKSQAELPRELLFQCMEVIRRARVSAPVKRGDILIQDILGTGIHIIACGDVALGRK
jgi:CxxC motif-containing protein